MGDSHRVIGSRKGFMGDSHRAIGSRKGFYR